MGKMCMAVTISVLEKVALLAHAVERVWHATDHFLGK